MVSLVELSAQKVSHGIRTGGNRRAIAVVYQPAMMREFVSRGGMLAPRWSKAWPFSNDYSTLRQPTASLNASNEVTF